MSLAEGDKLTTVLHVPKQKKQMIYFATFASVANGFNKTNTHTIRDYTVE